LSGLQRLCFFEMVVTPNSSQFGIIITTTAVFTREIVPSVLLVCQYNGYRVCGLEEMSSRPVSGRDRVDREAGEGPLMNRKVVSVGVHAQKDFYNPRYNDITLDSIKFHVNNGNREHDVIRVLSPRPNTVADKSTGDAQVSPRPVTAKPVDTTVITGFVVGNPVDRDGKTQVCYMLHGVLQCVKYVPMLSLVYYRLENMSKLSIAIKLLKMKKSTADCVSRLRRKITLSGRCKPLAAIFLLRFLAGTIQKAPFQLTANSSSVVMRLSSNSVRMSEIEQL
jgi:hypothetical protein